jgi:uncharacterized protein (DUF305 family)
MAMPSPPPPHGWTRVGLALLLAASAGAIAALLIASRLATPRDDSAEAGFARDMATHHAQAVEMSFVIRDKSTDEELRTLAYDIIATQSTQRGVFMGWLQEWGLPQASPGPRMAWMPGHAGGSGTAGHHAARMHGMASDDELRRLRSAEGTDAEILFLQLMIRHHEGGVLMARALAGRSRRDGIVQIAKSIEEGQAAEVAQMTAMLAKRGARPYDSLLE